MPSQVHGALLYAISDSEMSRVRTEFYRLRLITAIPPHPAQPNRQPASHRYLGNAFVSTHRQVHVPTSTVGMDTCRCLGCFHQQEAQQRITLLADVSKSLLASTGALRHAKASTTLDLYSQAMDESKLAAQRDIAMAITGEQAQAD
jgi:hypothetical protein